MLGDPLATYLAEIETYSTLSWPERQDLLALARAGDEVAKKSLIQATLRDVARIAISCAEPAWMNDLDKIQEANVVFLRLIDDSKVEDLRAGIRAEIPLMLARLAREHPEGHGDDPSAS